MGHDPQVTRVHYYHGEACALGGRLERPFEQVIPSQASVSLSPAGGFASTKAEQYRLGTIVSFESAYTQVSGGTTESGSYSTMVTSVVEGLNVLNTFTAKRMVAQLSIDHPREGHIPRVNFIGTQYQDVRIGGKAVDIVVDLDVCKQGDGLDFPNQWLNQDESFLGRVADQRERMMQSERTPEWVRQRYPSNSEAQAVSPSILCSLVTEIRDQDTPGNFPGQKYGNVFEVAEFGKGFLGELIVDGTSFRLVMLRLELGCGTKGSFGFGSGSGNGSTSP